ncbi:MAG: 4-(cytidine 5'-diphospho)-2-C-methyl-D-erythritol kinase [Henriciella sp.]|uniref:4-(cytidine 5'-diphospho)-2-C-methyl-D-erythritol kinase n=1 Tax=Henriciella sp. TaxID=1968823 RepID=UPI003C72C84D
MLAPAKVNLFLHVDGVKPNGRHDLDSLVVFAGPEAADRLEARKAGDLSLSLKGPFAATELQSPENLVLRVISACEAKGLSVPALSVTLHKAIPVAAGLGGGSADAGAMLRILMQLGGLTEPVAMKIASELGGDVPVAVHSRACLMRGEGEALKAAPAFPDLPALLVNPGLPCPTGAVFHTFDSQGGGRDFTLIDMPAFSALQPLCDWLRSATTNDLQAPAITILPEIGTVLDALARQPGCEVARMSGSGATCFAIFRDMAGARRAARTIESRQPDWWVTATQLSGNTTG